MAIKQQPPPLPELLNHPQAAQSPVRQSPQTVNYAQFALEGSKYNPSQQYPKDDTVYLYLFLCAAKVISAQQRH